MTDYLESRTSRNDPLLRDYVEDRIRQIHPEFNQERYRGDRSSIRSRLDDTKFQVTTTGTTIRPSDQKHYQELHRRLKEKRFVAAELAESVRLIYDTRQFPPQLRQSLKDAGWHPDLVNRPTLSEAERRIGVPILELGEDGELFISEANSVKREAREVFNFYDAPECPRPTPPVRRTPSLSASPACPLAVDDLRRPKREREDDEAVALQRPVDARDLDSRPRPSQGRVPTARRPGGPGVTTSRRTPSLNPSPTGSSSSTSSRSLTRPLETCEERKRRKRLKAEREKARSERDEHQLNNPPNIPGLRHPGINQEAPDVGTGPSMVAEAPIVQAETAVRVKRETSKERFAAALAANRARMRREVEISGRPKNRPAVKRAVEEAASDRSLTLAGSKRSPDGNGYHPVSSRGVSSSSSNPSHSLSGSTFGPSSIQKRATSSQASRSTGTSQSQSSRTLTTPTNNREPRTPLTNNNSRSTSRASIIVDSAKNCLGNWLTPAFGRGPAPSSDPYELDEQPEIKTETGEKFKFPYWGDDNDDAG
ncbi:hypothetical protein B0T16DRAFT_497669 [Cercophora newfieldiana]|uniref:Uncharacterized protein n=1 Tax=Cercophora newfieldiana TaxID=92897 RepID=A0AA39XSW4_9PEZI|nr:hypothetical protein B0T16DRAFT_497669 [Cercophora newfieldiana]